VVLCASFAKFPLPVPERWRGAVRPWMFRFQPLWLLSLVLLGRHGFGTLGRMLREAVRTVTPRAFAARAKAVANVDVSGELQDCSVPLLYLRASSDLVIRPSCLRFIQSLRSDVEVVVLPGPHLVLQVSPQGAVDALHKFCMKLRTTDNVCGAS
jgi:pimeloyl-ACP methyl ester carboxylesterase